MKRFTFDVKLFATITVPAPDEKTARKMLDAEVNCASCNFGAWPNGDPILGEASVDDACPDLVEVDGEAA